MFLRKKKAVNFIFHTIEQGKNLMPLTDPLNRPGTPGSIASVHTTLTHATTSAAVSAPPKWHRELPIQETLKLVVRARVLYLYADGLA